MTTKTQKVIASPKEAIKLIPPRLALNIGALVTYTQTNRDAFIILVSKEGEGKSTLAQIMGAVANGFGGNKYELDSNLYDESEFKEKVFQTTDKIYIIDEGTSMFLRADALSKWGKERVKILSQMRSRRHILLVTLTESGLGRVDPQMLHDRATAMVRITKRGRFQWFNKQNLVRLEIDTNKRMVKRWPPHNWAGNFKKLPKAWYTEYENYKHAQLEKYHTGEDAPTILEEYIPLKEAALRLKVSVDTIKKRCRDAVYRAMKTGAGYWVVHNEDIRKAEQLILASQNISPQ